MSFRISVADTHRIRVYRSGAHSVASSAGVVPFDAVSPLVSALGYTLAGGVVTALAPGYHRFGAWLQIESTLLLSGISLAFEADQGAGFVAVAQARWPATGSAIVSSAVFTPFLTAGIDLPAGGMVRLIAQGAGAASAAMTPGDGLSFLEASHRPPT